MKIGVSYQQIALVTHPDHWAAAQAYGQAAS